MVFSQGERHLSLGDTLAQVEAVLGPWPEPSNPLHTFADKIVVRLDDGHIVMLTMGGAPCPWVLKVDDAVACQLGERLVDLRKRLGSPRVRFSKPIKQPVKSAPSTGAGGGGSEQPSPKGEALLWIYYGALGDAGLLFVDDELQSVLLAEPGRLEAVLPNAGYTRLGAEP